MIKIALIKRLLMLMIGSTLAGFGIGIWNVTNLGYDPLNILYHALSNISHIRFSTITLIGGVVLLILTLIIDYKELGIGTLIALYLMSFGIQMAVDIISLFTYSNIMIGLLLHFIGLFILCFGVGLIIKARLGKAIYDAFIFSLAKKFKIKFEYIRYIFDGLFFVVGIILKGSFGIGSFIAWIGIPLGLKYFIRILKCEEF